MIVRILLLVIFSITLIAGECKNHLQEVLGGAKFINIQNSRFHLTLPGKKQPIEKISVFIEEFEKKLKNTELYKNELFDKYILKRENVPESFFVFQRRLLRERGYGNIELDSNIKNELIEKAIKDQKQSLSLWINYLASDDALYPSWAKYWVIDGITKISNFNKESGKFAKRNKSTIDKFPELNYEVLSLVISDVIEKTKSGNFSNLNFGKLYAKKLNDYVKIQINDFKEVKGEWVKYNKGSDHMKLVRSLEGKGTGWCTIGEFSAKSQLDMGDFYVYYSLDKYNNPNVPRVAIRFEGKRIQEIRGISKSQNLDEGILKSDVIANKMREFGEEGSRYLEKVEDMKKLTLIERKNSNSEELSSDELKFLYEIDKKIEGFAFQSDPRINEIIEIRDDIRGDLSKALNIRPEQVSFTKKEALSGNIVYHYGDLNFLTEESLYGVVLPKFIRGSLNFASLTDPKDLLFPVRVGGSLFFDSLIYAQGIVLPKSIGWNLAMDKLKVATDVTFPVSIHGSLFMKSISDIKKVNLPKFIDEKLLLGLSFNRNQINLIPSNINVLFR